MELARYLRLARRWWWLFLLGMLIGGGSAYGISQLMTPVYRASATLLVNQTQTPGMIAYNDILTSERLTMTYQELITKRPVLEEVVEALDLELGAGELGGLIGVSVVRDTQLLRLSVRHQEPDQARLLANAVSRAFIDANGQDGLAGPGSVTIVEPAATPVRPVSPRTNLNVVMGLFVGLVLAAGVALLYEYLDDTIKNPEDVEEAAGLPTLGGVTRFPKATSNPASSLVASSFRGAAEAYNILRTNVQFSAVDEPLQTILVSSASPGEGKSVTVANLGVAMAQTGQRVIVVDSDMRRPTLHRIFELKNEAGLTSALLSRGTDAASFLQPTRQENLRVLTSGPIPPNPSELLASTRLEAVIDALRTQADVIILDSPPALVTADAAILAAKADGSILVVDTSRTRVQALRRASDALNRSKTRVLGAVLNNLKERAHGYYYDYTYDYAPSGNGANGHRRWRLPWGRKSKAQERESVA